MHKKMTISLDLPVYKDVLQSHVLDTALDAGYQGMAADTARESDAAEWIQSMNVDLELR